MRSSRKLAALLLVAVAVVGASAQPATAKPEPAPVRPPVESVGVVTKTAFTTLATAGCGSSCNDENPNTFTTSSGAKCVSDATTIEQVNPSDDPVLKVWGVTIQLRYSAKCRTVWARGYGLHRANTLWVWVNPHTSYDSKSLDVEYPYSSDYVGGTGYMWSRMMNDAGQQSIVCFSSAHQQTPGPGVACTRNPF